jgi:methylglyoxal synthase
MRTPAVTVHDGKEPDLVVCATFARETLARSPSLPRAKRHTARLMQDNVGRTLESFLIPQRDAPIPARVATDEFDTVLSFVDRVSGQPPDPDVRPGVACSTVD